MNLIYPGRLQVLGSGGGYQIPAASGSGSTYYVATTGNDSNDGSEGSPWATAGKAASTATTAGDVVVFEDGTYTATSSPWVTFSNSGTLGSPIVWVARNAGGAVFDGDLYNDFGLLLQEVDHRHFQGIEIKNFAYGAIWSNGLNTTQATGIKFSYCAIHHNGRTPRNISDSLGYVGMYGNGNSRDWIIEKCSFYNNGRINNTDFDDETSANNHTYRHDHHIYLEGHGHIIRDNYFFEAPGGYPIRISGYWGDSLSSGEYSLEVSNNYFGQRGNESPYTDVHGSIGVYNNQTNHGTYGNLKEPVLNVYGNVVSDPQVGLGTDTFVGFFNDAQSYGSTDTEHRIVNNTVASASTYNEGESWMSSHTGITATGNVTSSTVSGATLTAWESAAQLLTGVDIRQSGNILWNPHILAEAQQLAWFAASDSASVTEVSSVVSDWASQYYTSYSLTQGTAANRPDYVSGDYLSFVDGSDFLINTSDFDSFTNGDFIFLVVGADTKGSSNGWFRFTDYGGGSGFQLNHFNTSWYAYCHNTSNATSVSFSSAGYTANTPIMFSFACDAGTSFEVFENGDSKGSMTPSAAWTSTEMFLVNGGGSRGPSRMYDVMMIPGSVSTAVRQRAEGFLAWKHGLQNSLPLGHPYRSVRSFFAEV